MALANTARSQIWSSGGGVQSAAIAALIVQGVLQKPDFAVIVDTNREQSSTWSYLDEIVAPALLKVGVKLHRVSTASYAKVDLYGGVNKSTLLIPAFTNFNGSIGKLPTFCSNEWKQRVARRWAREMGVKSADFWMGISIDEMRRLKFNPKANWRFVYPLVNEKMNRQDCEILVKNVGWPPAPRSSCWMCPNHTQAEWRDIKSNKPNDWAKVVVFDAKIREFDANVFLHPDCVPIDQADLSDPNGVLFGHGCQSGNCFS